MNTGVTPLNTNPPQGKRGYGIAGIPGKGQCLSQLSIIEKRLFQIFFGVDQNICSSFFPFTGIPKPGALPDPSRPDGRIGYELFHVEWK
jgi:hypothetical protein